MHVGQAGCVRVGARVALVDRVDVGEQDEQVSGDEVGDERGQPIVSTEADLVGRDRVVLVQQRDDAQRQQPLERAAGVAVVRPADDVFAGQQHLADRLGVAAEAGRVALGEQQLTDAGTGLQRREVAGAARQPERRDSRGDGAAGDQHDVAGLPGEHVDEGVDPARVQATLRGSERGRTDLHHYPARLGDERAAHDDSRSAASRSS